MKGMCLLPYYIRPSAVEDLQELRPRVVAWNVKMRWFEGAAFGTLNLQRRCAGGGEPPSGAQLGNTKLSLKSLTI